MNLRALKERGEEDGSEKVGTLERGVGWAYLRRMENVLLVMFSPLVIMDFGS